MSDSTAKQMHTFSSPSEAPPPNPNSRMRVAIAGQPHSKSVTGFIPWSTKDTFLCGIWMFSPHACAGFLLVTPVSSYSQKLAALNCPIGVNDGLYPTSCPRSAGIGSSFHSCRGYSGCSLKALCLWSCKRQVLSRCMEILIKHGCKTGLAASHDFFFICLYLFLTPKSHSEQRLSRTSAPLNPA